jgi:GntR family transcriptional regulator, transcriptional repressor for pyruvate dehydrogenase complex
MPSSPIRRPRPLALDLVDALSARIADACLGPGARLPTEAALMAEFGVSRTVVREALSKLQAAGLVETRHGVGTFVREGGARSLGLVGAGQAAALLDVVAVLELRLGLEGEAAALAAVRRSRAQLAAMRAAQADLLGAIASGGDSVAPDRRLHQQIAAATCNAHFVELMGALGGALIPRARIDTPALARSSPREYLLRVHTEHDSIVNAIANRDPEAARAAMRTHLSNSRDRLRRAQPAALVSAPKPSRVVR